MFASIIAQLHKSCFVLWKKFFSFSEYLVTPHGNFSFICCGIWVVFVFSEETIQYSFASPFNMGYQRVDREFTAILCLITFEICVGPQDFCSGYRPDFCGGDIINHQLSKLDAPLIH